MTSNFGLKSVKMNTPCVTYTIIVLSLVKLAASIENKDATTSEERVNSFVGQLTSLINEGLSAEGRPNIRYPYPPDYPTRPGPGFPGPGRPYPPPPGPPGPPPPGRPLPGGPPLPGRPFPGGPPPPGRPFPGGPPQLSYPGQGGGYPSTGLMAALSSISRYDDLRCVPRLLCEVASGSRPGSYPSSTYYQQQSPLPFLSRDALITLLTVLSFVDDSPLLVFGRAALLGYTAKGDPRACQVAYPTCPRDPEQLVDYLNNHNGGFFSFFSQQQIPQYAPQYQYYATNRPPLRPPPGYPQPVYPPPDYPSPGYQPPGYPPQRPPPYPPQRPGYPSYYQSPYYPQQYSTKYQQYQHPQQRIQTRPDASVDYNQIPSSATGDSNSLNFPSGGSYDYEVYYNYNDPSTHQYYYTQQSNTSDKKKLVFPESTASEGNRGGKGLKFPASDQLGQVKPALPMVFPDRTGTGDLRLQLDEFGGYKTVYFASTKGDAKKPTVFRDQRDIKKATITFPVKDYVKFVRENEKISLASQRESKQNMVFPNT